MRLRYLKPTLLILTLTCHALAFSPQQLPPRRFVKPSNGGTHGTLPLFLSPPDLATSFSTSVDTFEGSSIVDPVIIGNTFWGALKGKILSVLIGQFLAIVVFGFLVNIASQQIGNVLRMLLGDKNQRTAPPQVVIPTKQNAGPTRFDAGRLLLCLAIDLLGSANEVIPVAGEIVDVLYAPLAATLLRQIFGSNIVFTLEFAEEVLPFTDILPLATICFVVDTFLPESEIAKLLKIGYYSSEYVSQDEDGTVVNVDARESRGRR